MNAARPRENARMHTLASELFGVTDSDEEGEVEESILADVGDVRDVANVTDLVDAGSVAWIPAESVDIEMADAWSTTSASTGTQSSHASADVETIADLYSRPGDPRISAWAVFAGGAAALLLVIVLLATLSIVARLE